MAEPDEDRDLRSVVLQNAAAILRTRRLAEEAQTRLAAIVESSDDAIVTKTLEGVIRTWNGGAERIFGYTAAEAVGRPITLIIPPERHGEETDILARLRRGERVDHFETVRVAKDGRRLDISLTVSPLRDADGRVVGASKIARDITEKKRLERELRRRAEELAEADRKKDDFIALLAHELRNPLAPLRNGLELIRLAGNADSVVGKARAMMDRQLTHMVRLIDDLLDVSRITRGKLHLQKTRVSLVEVVGYAVEATEPAIAAARHELTVTLPAEPVYLDADLTRLAQVFGNLLSNSAKYTEPGGRIWLTASLRDEGGRRKDESRQGLVTDSSFLLPPSSFVEVAVRDTGIGIPTDALPHVFDMFAQVDRSAERESGGLGIGLALVKGLVEMHGGAVTAESAGPGAGCTFTVRLPLVKDEGGGMKDEAVSSFIPPPSSFSRRVLVVDDNRDGAESMATMLGLLGYEVHEAHDGVEAVEAAERVRPDVVLMDVGMPRLDGLNATRRIRERPWGGAVTIVALTGWGQDADRERSKAAGCDAHLVKPVDLAELERLLAELTKR